MNKNLTPEECARVEKAQRICTVQTERDPELVAAAAIAFAAGLAVAAGRKQEESHEE